MAHAKHHSSTKKIFTVFVLAILSGACGFAQPTPTPEPSATPQPSNTPKPTRTATALPTETATATEDLAATESAQATADTEALIEDEIAPILEEVGVSPDSGHLAWTQDKDVRIITREYSSFIVEPYGGDKEYGDFVLFTNVNWESSGGLALCGVSLRAERDFENGAQYVFLTIRFSGLPLWDVELHDNGFIISSLNGEPKANSAINQDNGSTNEYIFVAQGTTLTVYANGTRMNTVTVAKLHEGFFGAVASQQSGETTCTFTDGWVWSLDE